MRILILFLFLSWCAAQEIQLEKIKESGVSVEAKPYSVTFDAHGIAHLQFSIDTDITLYYACKDMLEKTFEVKIKKENNLIHECAERAYFSLPLKPGRYIVDMKSEPGREIVLSLGYR